MGAWDRAARPPRLNRRNIAFGEAAFSVSERFNHGAIERLPAGGRVLEVGCGAATNLAAYLERHPRAQGTGIDVAAGAVAGGGRLATELGLAERMTLVHGDYASLAGNYEVVLAVQVLNHEPNLDRFMAFAAERIPPGGHLLVADVQPIGRLARAADHMRDADEVVRAATGFTETSRTYGLHTVGRALLPVLHRLSTPDHRPEPVRQAVKGIYRGLAAAVGAEDRRRSADPTGALYAVTLCRD